MLSKARTVRLNDIEIIGTAPVGREQDFLTVRRPYGPDIDGGRADQLTLVAAIVVHQVDIKNPVSVGRSEEHTSELQSRGHLVCRLLLEKKNSSLRNITTSY